MSQPFLHLYLPGNIIILAINGSKHLLSNFFVSLVQAKYFRFTRCSFIVHLQGAFISAVEKMLKEYGEYQPESVLAELAE